METFTNGEFVTYFSLALEEALTEREARIMSLRFGLVDGTPWTLQSIAEVLGISRERVRQIETRTMRKLRYKKYTGKPGTAGMQMREYLSKVLRPGKAGDFDRLASFVQDDLGYLVSRAQFKPLLELFSAWIRASNGYFSEEDLMKRVAERLIEQEAALRREAKVERNRAAFWAHLDSAIIWPDKCCAVELPLSLLRQRDVDPESHGQVGAFESEKLGRPVQYESQLEQQFLLRLEQSTDVIYYLEQPFRIPYNADSGDRVYIPDVFFVLADNRGVVAEIKPRHQIVLSENLRKWPVLRDFCKKKGYGRLITDGRVGIRTFWEHPVPEAYRDSVLTALADGLLTWPQYNELREQHSPSWDDFISLVLQHKLVWSMHPFCLQLASRSPERTLAHAD